jgi:hypothetical protein
MLVKLSPGLLYWIKPSSLNFKAQLRGVRFLNIFEFLKNYQIKMQSILFQIKMAEAKSITDESEKEDESLTSPPPG